MSAINYIELAKAAKHAASECIHEARLAERSETIRSVGARITCRDEHGNDAAPFSLMVLPIRQLNADNLRALVKRGAPAQYSYIAIAGECVESLDGEMVGFWEVDSRELMTNRDKHKPRPERSDSEDRRDRAQLAQVISDPAASGLSLAGVQSLFDKL